MYEVDGCKLQTKHFKVLFDSCIIKTISAIVLVIVKKKKNEDESELYCLDDTQKMMINKLFLTL